MDDKTQYFIDYWRDLTHEKNSIENDLIHSMVYNPKELIKEFIDEIERKNLSNKDNKKFFIDSLGSFARLDLKALSFINPTLKLILKGQNSDHSYLAHLLNMALIKLDNFELGKKAVEELADILTDGLSIEKDKIKQLVNLIIFELIHKKYSKKTIINIIDYIFSSYQILQGNTIYTSFPHQIECQNWDKESDKYQDYKKTLKEYLENLTEKKRVLALNNYFTKEPNNYRYIFQIKGLKGDNVNITIGNVQIYNPKTVSLFKNSTERFNERFERQEQDPISYCNGAVRLDVIDSEYAKQEALQILENTLDLIASRYMSYNIPLVINQFEYYIIDDKGNQIDGVLQNTWEYLTYQDSLQLENSKYDNPIYKKQISKDKLLEVDNKIIESMHWNRKAIEANESNEKILWNWVALENLFEKKNSSEKIQNTIFRVVSKLLTKKYMYNFAWKHYWKLKVVASPKAQLHNSRTEIELPSRLMQDIQLQSTEGETIHLSSLIDNIDELLTHLDENSLMYDQFQLLNNIFTEKKKCIELINSFEKIFFEKLVYIYRLRNKIVHHAYSESNPLVDYYVKFINLATATSINEFIQVRGTLSLKTNQDIINNIVYEYDEFKFELNEKGAGILL